MSSYCDETMGVSRSLEQVGSYLVTRLIWQHMGGEGGDRRPHRRLVFLCGFEGESLVGLLGWKRTSGRQNRAGLSGVSWREKP